MNTAGGKAAKAYWDNPELPLFYDKMSLAATEAMKQDVKHAMQIFSGK